MGASKDFQKLAGLWLAGEMVNRIGIYGSKVAEGLSAFQRRSCFIYRTSDGVYHISFDIENNILSLKIIRRPW